jgi:hypothetical protein
MTAQLLRGTTVSDAWLAAVRGLRHQEKHRAYHLVVGIEEPLNERPDVREAVDTLLCAVGRQPVDTVANTIFPAQLAATCETHAEVAARYQRMYSRLRKFPGNNMGTYFGRLIAYPVGRSNPPDYIDQLGRIIHNLGRTAPGLPSAKYEATLEIPRASREGQESRAEAAEVHHVARDSNPIGFPCLSHLAFQVEGTRLHAVASYRSQYLVERGYGNYLGLGRLLGYVAAHSGLTVGNLTIVAGYAQVEKALRRIDNVLARFEAA